MSETEKMKLTLASESDGLCIAMSGKLAGTLENWEGGDYCCEKIRIYIPVGTQEEDLFLDNGEVTIESENAGWNVSKLSEGERGINGEKILELRAIDGGERPLKKEMKFIVSGRVGPCEGECAVKYEYYIRKKEEAEFTPEEKSFTFEKKRADFYLRNFMAANEKTPLLVQTEFEPGEPIYFSWESNGTGYELYASEEGETKLVCGGQGTSCLYKEGIRKDTTFFLKALKTTNQKKLRNGRRELYGAITLTTAKQSLSEVKVTEHFEAEEAESVSILGKCKLIDAPKSGKKKKAQAGTDGFLMGHLLYRGEQGNTPSSAYIRISVYALEEKGYHEQYTIQDNAYRGKLSGENGDLVAEHFANLCAPIAKGQRVIMECSKLPDGYDVQWEFIPMGGGTVQEV